MRTVKYKGFQASVEFDENALFIKVLHIDDLLIAQVDNASEVQKEFEVLIDAYLADCAELGKEPTKPFKGSFNVRLTPARHRRVAMQAADEGTSLNNWVRDAIDEKLQCGKLSKRLDGVFEKQNDNLQQHIQTQWAKRVAKDFDVFEYAVQQELIRSDHDWEGARGYDTGAISSMAALMHSSGKKLHG
ncbi:MAG: type II toxin-antitoxin system HicB family antitoxin [Roseibium sp.]|uniref:type II toxin-antitoxin system HicB family antitoxin n=1 Tax=Roseibium sp. TaxID=1936156 RepID=UPI001B14BBD1|nr:type II toxin-antitoxin system HicB family antitoxin [Roseibium sp.]MBO6893406.1 type II toxin-antitoxin system HicB family antitoxin [Roseibium sp.]MBO6930718.1 type II toxin-antitoxin system HicB family antitoxin [Roseibium sp.]